MSVSGTAGLSIWAVDGPTTHVARFWAAQCDASTEFSSLATPTPGIGFVRFAGTTTMHVRGPAAKATTMPCPEGAEYFGVDFRPGAYLRPFPPARLADRHDAVLPTLSDGRVLLDARAWEMPTPENLGVFVDRLDRAGMLVHDRLIDDLRHGDAPRALPERTAQSRFLRAVGVSRRTLALIERTREAARWLRAGTAIADVVAGLGFYDQPHLTRMVRRLIGYTPAEVARGRVFLDL